MEIVILVNKENFQKVKDMLLKDDVVSRASIIFKDASSLGFDEDGYYCHVSGSEKACKKVEELTKDFAKKTKNADEVLEKIKEEESIAMTGFGDIFG